MVSRCAFCSPPHPPHCRLPRTCEIRKTAPVDADINAADKRKGTPAENGSDEELTRGHQRRHSATSGDTGDLYRQLPGVSANSGSETFSSMLLCAVIRQRLRYG